MALVIYQISTVTQMHFLQTWQEIYHLDKQLLTPAHGATKNDYWFGNVVETGGVDYVPVQANAAQVAIFRP